MGCNLCSNLAPESFGYLEGKAKLLAGREVVTGIYETISDNVDAVEQAASVCPVLAIEVRRS